MVQSDRLRATSELPEAFKANSREDIKILKGNKVEALKLDGWADKSRSKIGEVRVRGET